ncbi:MAG: hypothetical protein KAH23_05370 [Kiritimatiellae bacterium]|nr:hypothetical protein [Kiritimatiellia bacterium]
MTAISRSLTISLLALIMSGMALGVSFASEYDLGFFASRDVDLDGNARFRMLGPLVEWQKSEDNKTFRAIRPLFSYTANPDRDRSLTEILWPISMFKNYRDETFWRLLMGFGHDFDDDDYGDRYRFVVFPLLYAGTSVKQSRYFGLFPVGGKIEEFLGRDKIWFFMFPLYMYSSIHDVSTHDVLWPFLSYTKGAGVSRYRVWPLYARSYRKDQWTKTSMLWPIWNSVKYDYPDQKGGGFMFFPLFGYAGVEDRKTWWLLPPFFKYAVSDDVRQLNCPYPFVQYRSSEDSNKLYLWPIWGRKSSPGVKSGFVCWPICSYQSLDRPEHKVKTFQITPIISYESRIAKKTNDGATNKTSDRMIETEPDHPEDPEVLARYFKLWPLMSYRRECDVMRFRMLELWPARSTPSIEKNFAPFWTLYSRQRNGELKEDELLWGMFRYRRDKQKVHKLSLFPLFCWRNNSDQSKNKRGWSVLMGMFGYKREGLRKTIKVLYFPIEFGKSKEDQDENMEVVQEY